MVQTAQQLVRETPLRVSTEKSPYHVASQITDYFLDLITEKKIPGFSDPMGLNTLNILVGTLAAINAPTKIWGQVADFVLKRATIGFIGLYIYHENILCSLAPHVSDPVLAKIVDHVAHAGRLETLTKLTHTYLHRDPSFVEVVILAKAHCPEHWNWTNPKDKIWDDLLALAHPSDVPTIQELRAKARERQKISDNSIY